MPHPDSTFLRPLDGRVLAGVAAALARRAGLDVTWVRGAFVVVALLAAWGSLWALLLVAALYGAGVALIPSEER